MNGLMDWTVDCCCWIAWAVEYILQRIVAVEYVVLFYSCLRAVGPAWSRHAPSNRGNRGESYIMHTFNPSISSTAIPYHYHKIQIKINLSYLIPSIMIWRDPSSRTNRVWWWRWRLVLPTQIGTRLIILPPPATSPSLPHSQMVSAIFVRD